MNKVSERLKDGGNMTTQKPEKELENWQKDFDARFVFRSYMGNNIKQFISTLLSRQRQELLGEVEETIGGMKKTYKDFYGEINGKKVRAYSIDVSLFYNQALSDLQAKIKEMK